MMSDDQFTELVDFLAKKFTRIDQRFDAIDQRLDGMDQRFDAMDLRFDAMDLRFAAADQRTLGLSERLTRLEVRVEATGDDIRALADGFVMVSDRVGRLGASMNQRFDEQRQLMYSLLGGLDTRVRALENPAN